jgi:hypothetical protein
MRYVAATRVNHYVIEHGNLADILVNSLDPFGAISIFLPGIEG